MIETIDGPKPSTTSDVPATGHTRLWIDLEDKVVEVLRLAADRHGLTVVGYILARAFGPYRSVEIVGDLVPAPRENDGAK